MKNKKALGWGFVIFMLLAIIILMILFMSQTRMKEIYKDLTNKNVCKSSVRAMDIISIKNLAVSDQHGSLFSDIKCPMQNIEIKSKNPEDIKRELARHYYNVCDEFGQGTLNLFGNRETTFCVIRDKITFSNKGIIIEDFGKYLAETDIPGKGLKYSEFCSGFKTERAEVFAKNDVAQLPDMPLDTNKEYVIIYVYIKGEEELREFTSLAFGTSSAHITQYIGAGLIVGGGYLMYTGKGAILGIPMLIGGNLVVGGFKTLSIGLIWNALTNKDLKMEWASFFLIREFNEEELKKLPCEYLPA